MDKVTTTSTHASSEVNVPRRFSATYKLAILAQLEAVTDKGQVGQILRREGLYSSLISEWRKQRDRGALAALQGKTPSRALAKEAWSQGRCSSCR